MLQKVIFAFLLHCVVSQALDHTERTFVMIKPAGVQRQLIGKIIERFEEKGFKLVGMKFMIATRDKLEKQFSELHDQPFFTSFMTYMSSGPVVSMVWEGLNVVKSAHAMLGDMDPSIAAPGTIRGDFSIHIARNIIHGSNTVDSAKEETALWFNEEEMLNWTSHDEKWLYV